jgi:hypothetical protein
MSIGPGIIDLDESDAPMSGKVLGIQFVWATATMPIPQTTTIVIDHRDVVESLIEHMTELLPQLVDPSVGDNNPVDAAEEGK